MATLPGNSTIDATNDNNGLVVARKFNAQSRTHGDVSTCANNLDNTANSKVIVGHGDTAVIITGSGQYANDPAKYVSLTNQPNWENHLKRIKNCTTLSLYACHPGASRAGADFLFNLARVINAIALGPTGFLYIDNKTGVFTLEAGSTWQTATPTTRPSPIDPPHPYFLDVDPMDNISLMTIDGKRAVPRSSIVQVRLRTYSTGSVIAGNLVSTATLSGPEASSLIEFIAFDRPFTPPGSPLALVTAEIELVFDDGTTRGFTVLNNRIVHDMAFEDVYYYCRPGFEDLIR